MLLAFAASAFAAQHATPDEIQERNAQLQILMDRAQPAETPAERQKVMNEYMKTMELQMAAVKEMTRSGVATDGPRQSSSVNDKSALQMQKTMQSMMKMMMQSMQHMQQPESPPAP